MKLLPLLALALTTPVAARTPAPVAPQRIDVTMTHDGFVPSRIGLRSGGAYVLRVANRSDKGHNLTQEVFFREARVAPGDRALVPDGKIRLAAGERVAVRFRAPVNRPGATYQFSSTVLGDATGDYKGVFVIR